MKKQLMILMTAALLLAGCNSNEEEDALKQYGVEDTKSCDNLAAVKQAGDKLKDKESVYCAITTDKNLDQATAFVKKDYDAKRISEFLNLPYYHKELTERYIAYDDGKRAVQDIVTKVNIGLDQPYFTNVDIIRDTDDVALLVNKYHRLPDDYEPQNLVDSECLCNWRRFFLSERASVSTQGGCGCIFRAGEGRKGKAYQYQGNCKLSQLCLSEKSV